MFLIGMCREVDIKHKLITFAAEVNIYDQLSGHAVQSIQRFAGVTRTLEPEVLLYFCEHHKCPEV